MTNQNELIDLTIDVETYYDSEYSLDKMPTAQYVMDPRFEIIGVSFSMNGMPTQWITGDLAHVHAELEKIPWDRCRVIAHNARFEAAVLEWRLGFKPASYLCTLVGSRPHLVPYAGGASLDALLRYTGLGVKGTYVKQAKAKHRTDFTAEEMAEYGDYCCNDTDGCYALANRIRSVLPADEQELIDLTIKKYVRPTLCLNKNALLVRLGEIENEKAKRLDELSATYGVGLSDIRSRDKFAQILGAALGSNGKVPTKTSKANGSRTYAFAKDDVEFKNLLVHADPRVRDLVGAKLYFSSTLEEGRIRRLVEMYDVLGGRLAVPLVYYGAHTGRFSGDESIKVQNLPRVEWLDKSHTTLRKGHLRYAVCAQPGYSIVAADLSNIEARIVATLAGQTDLIEGFRRGEDLYSWFASMVYGFLVDKVAHPKERFVGKTCILGLGYGMGWRKFQLKMAQEGIIMSEQEAKRIVYLYRNTFTKIPALWRDFNYAGTTFLTDKSAMYPWRGLIFAHERIILPNGMPILYPGITHTTRGLGFRGRFGKPVMDNKPLGADDLGDLSNVWGGAFLENTAQGLARIIITVAELTLARMGIVAALQAHDELVFHIPTIIVEQVKKVIAQVMTAVVPFMPDLPMAVEIHHGPTYGDAK